MRLLPTLPKLHAILVVVTAVTLSPAAVHAQTPSPPPALSAPATAVRPRIGVALGGGSARGLAHVGVLRWLEEHHIPVDVVAGTSMGGLIGGSYATGMTPDEVEAMLASIDWNAMFGTRIPVRERPQQARLARLPVAPRIRPQERPLLALAQQRPAGGSAAVADRRRVLRLDTFDELPTPFRCVALDLVTAEARGARSRAPRPRHARDDVAAGGIPAGAHRQPGARRRRRRGQRAGRRRPRHGRGQGHRGERRRCSPITRPVQLAARARERDDRRHDARQHLQGHGRRRRRHQRPAQPSTGRWPGDDTAN